MEVPVHGLLLIRLISLIIISDYLVLVIVDIRNNRCINLSPLVCDITLQKIAYATEYDPARLGYLF